MADKTPFRSKNLCYIFSRTCVDWGRTEAKVASLTNVCKEERKCNKKFTWFSWHYIFLVVMPFRGPWIIRVVRLIIFGFCSLWTVVRNFYVSGISYPQLPLPNVRTYRNTDLPGQKQSKNCYDSRIQAKFRKTFIFNWKLVYHNMFVCISAYVLLSKLEQKIQATKPIT